MTHLEFVTVLRGKQVFAIYFFEGKYFSYSLSKMYLIPENEVQVARVRRALEGTLELLEGLS